MYYINGHYVKEEDAKISILDLGVLRGFGVFDYLRTYGGRPFHLQDHLMRLKYSATQIGLTLPQTLPEIEEIVHTVQQRNQLSEASIKILVTGGISADQFTPQLKGNLIVFAYPLSPYPPHFHREGIKVITTHLGRSLPTSKTTQYTSAIVALQGSRAQNVQEALYINAKGEILEATTSNFFAFKNDILYTCCSDEVLVGITREIVLRLCASRFPLEHKALHIDEIPDIQEAFITASNKEIMPVVEIDSQKVGNGRLGPKTELIMKLFRDYTQSTEWPPLHIPRHERLSPVFLENRSF